MVMVRCHSVVITPVAQGEPLLPQTRYYCSSECYAAGLQSVIDTFGGGRAIIVRRPDGKVYGYGGARCAVCESPMPSGSRDPEVVDDPYE